VKWRDPNGNDNNTPVPAGTAFNGILVAAPSNVLHLARDISGTDTDNASDWSYQSTTLASVNHPAPVTRTLFGTGDPDLFSFQATAGTRYGFEARGPYSATDPRIELLSTSGGVLGSNDNSDPGVRDARLDFFAGSSGTYYLRVMHAGTDTDWGEYDLMVFQHPASNSLQAPAGVTPTAVHGSDTSDQVIVKWLNSSSYDTVKVYRDSMLIATLPGSSSEHVDTAPRGLYRYEVSGVRGTTETARASGFEFAGLITCHAEDDFESGAAAMWMTDGSSWGTTPIAAGGTWGFTDSPAGTYSGCPGGTSGCKVNAIAVFGVPVRLPAGSSLEYDQICATEVGFDYCIVEVSADKGASWTELARYDQGSDPAWASGVADPSQYRHATLSLAGFANQLVLVRFRLESDELLQFDGWFVDNVHINDANCTPVASVGFAPMALRFSPPFPNPSVGGVQRFAFTLPARAASVELGLYDAQGRQLRVEKMGALGPGNHEWRWNGRDGGGHVVNAGVYFARLDVDGQRHTQKVLRLAR
jgi:flagellar hook capping protein FlgD